MTTSDTIVVTGFGIFRDHKLNPSWEAIRDGQLKIDRPNFEIITRQVSVSYKAVDKIVEELWDAHQPLLMVHVGLAAFERQIRIEKIARHGPYIHDDVVQEAPHKNLRIYSDEHALKSTGSMEENVKRHCYSCKPYQFDKSQTCLDIDKICDRLNELHASGKAPIAFKSSVDAGLYVCEYIYQKSLRFCDRTVFIHVPDVNQYFTIEDIRRSLELAIEALIDELNSV